VLLLYLWWHKPQTHAESNYARVERNAWNAPFCEVTLAVGAAALLPCAHAGHPHACCCLRACARGRLPGLEANWLHGLML